MNQFKVKALAAIVAAMLSGNAIAAGALLDNNNDQVADSTSTMIDETGGNVTIGDGTGAVDIFSTDGGNNTTTLSNTGISVTNDNFTTTTTISGTGITTTDLTVDTINGQAVSNFATSDQINALDTRIDSVAKKAYAGIASVAALAAIPGPAAGKQFSIGMGVGHYEGESAFAVGANAAVGQNLNVKVGVGHSNGKTTASAGASFSW